jgi:hypothetical protein
MNSSSRPPETQAESRSIPILRTVPAERAAAEILMAATAGTMAMGLVACLVLDVSDLRLPSVKSPPPHDRAQRWRV